MIPLDVPLGNPGVTIVTDLVNNIITIALIIAVVGGFYLALGFDERACLPRSARKGWWRRRLDIWGDLSINAERARCREDAAVEPPTFGPNVG